MTTEGPSIKLPDSIRVMGVQEADAARKAGEIHVVAANSTGLRAWRRGISPDGSSYTFPQYSTTHAGRRVALIEVTDPNAFRQMFSGDEFVADRGDLVRQNRTYGIRPSIQAILEELSPLGAQDVARRFNETTGIRDIFLSRIFERGNRAEIETLLSRNPNFMDEAMREAIAFLEDDLRLNRGQVAQLIVSARKRRGVQTLFGPSLVDFIQSNPGMSQPVDDRAMEVEMPIPADHIEVVIPLGHDERKTFGR